MNTEVYYAISTTPGLRRQALTPAAILKRCVIEFREVHQKQTDNQAEYLSAI